jgi:FtsH-binding integral membrane protein
MMRAVRVGRFTAIRSFATRSFTTFPKYSEYVTKSEMNKRHKMPVEPVTEITERVVEKEEFYSVHRSISTYTGMQKFLSRVYGTTCLSIATTLGLAQGLSHFGVALEHPLECFGIGIVASFGGLAGIMYKKYRIVHDSDGIRSENSPARMLSYGSFVTGMSLTLAPMVQICNEFSPTILPIATGLSIFTMAGASMFAYSRPADSLLVYKAPLMGALMGLVGVSASALVGGWIFGYNNLAIQLLHNVDLYGGILLFTGFTAYDTHRAIDMYKRNDPDHLGVATDMYLNFMNLMIRIMEITAKMQQKQ